jgi:hypothetical protein
MGQEEDVETKDEDDSEESQSENDEKDEKDEKDEADSPHFHASFLSEPIDYHYQQDLCFRFSPEQKEAMRVKLPMVFRGMPGTGKSSVALSILIEAIKEYKAKVEAGIPARPPRFLYTTSSKGLLSKIELEWKNACRDLLWGEEYQDLIDFKTYEDLIEENIRETQPEVNLHYLGEEDFSTWYQRQYCSNKQQAGLYRHDKKLASYFYQEIRLAAGMTEQQYLALGNNKQSFTSSPEERQEIYLIYKAYMAHIDRLNANANESLRDAGVGPRPQPTMTTANVSQQCQLKLEDKTAIR